MLMLEQALNVVLAPISILRHAVTSRVVRTITAGHNRAKRLRPRKNYSLPLLEYSHLSSLYFAIEQAVLDDEGYDHPEQVVEVWLRCVVAGQYFSDRLLMDIRAVERDLAFWKARLERGNNALFLAVARGPRQFAGALGALVRRLRGQEPHHRLQSSGRIEQRIVTLRTMHNALKSMLVRVHDAARGLAVAPAFKGVDADGASVASADAAANGGGGPVEVQEGATARTVAAAVDAFSAELLASAHSLRDLQRQLDEQAEGHVHLKVSAQPVLLALEAPEEAHAAEPAAVESVAKVPGTVMLAAQRLHDVRGALNATHVRLSWHGKPVAGLRHATAAADDAGAPLLRTPEFARAPSALQRFWVRYTFNCAGAAYAARFLYRNSPLAGSDNLQRWIHGGYTATLRGFRDNVVRPLSKVRAEFFETFGQRSSYSAFSTTDFQASKASLERMLAQFERDVASRDRRFDGAEASSRMDLLMRHYEKELRHPLRNALTGNLPRALLVQVHKMKTDLEAAMVELDQIMRANELTVAVTAALPAILVAALLAWGAWRLLSPPPPNMRTTAGPVRVAMAELEQAIDAAGAAEEKAAALAAADAPAEVVGPAREALACARGGVLVNIAKLRAVASSVYTLSSRSIAGAGDGGSWAREWRQLEADLLALAAEPATARQARIAARAHRSYLVFRS